MGLFSKSKANKNGTVKADAVESAFIEVDMEMNGVTGVEANKAPPEGGGRTGTTTTSPDSWAGKPARTSASTAAMTAAPLSAAATEGEVIDLDALDADSEPTGVSAVRDPDVSGVRAFAISDAIRLLQSLPPAPRVDMVVRVVRVTLGSANVSVEEMSEEIARRTRALEGKIDGLRSQADALEKQLHLKEAEIAGQQAELKHLVSVKARLQMTTQPEAHRPPPIPRAALKQAPPRQPAVATE